MKRDAIKEKITVKLQPIGKKTEAKSNSAAVNSSRKKRQPFVVAQNSAAQPAKITANKSAPAVAPQSKTPRIAASAKTTEPRITTDKSKTKKLKVISPPKTVKVGGEKVLPVKSARTIKPKAEIKSAVAPETSKTKVKKSEPLVSQKKVKPVAGNKVSLVSALRANDSRAKKVKSAASGILIKPKVQKPNSSISAKNSKLAGEKNKPNIIAPKKPGKQSEPAKSTPIDKTATKKIETTIAVAKLKIKAVEGNRIAANEKDKAAESKTETVNFPLEKKAKKKKIKPLGSAIFRGKKERYAFEVFPLDAEFDGVAAIYVISKRKTDRDRRAHHALVCIGQTDSVAGEIKRHRKKCIKKHQANVISILPEANEKTRRRIEEDLRSAHAIVCKTDSNL